MSEQQAALITESYPPNLIIYYGIRGLAEELRQIIYDPNKYKYPSPWALVMIGSTPTKD